MKISSKIIFILFTVLVAVQWYIPARMIFDKEKIISSGRKFKFKIAPVDPVDFFRGEYLTLNFQANRASVPCHEELEHGTEVYVVIGEDDSGFAKILGAGLSKPSGNSDIVRAKISWQEEDWCFARINYPFSRYYMKEGDAYDAEKLIREAVRDSTTIVYAEVIIRNGDAVITEIYLGDMPVEAMMDQKTYDESRKP